MIDEENPAWMRLIYALEEISYQLSKINKEKK